ncbi:hypothetical protein O181_076413 [Austropuccinia psidii MF-1]|uniref:Chromo domain-containing protein n=1 Tax=Austropuccinia psidii MF-1 TaxID=1389203 RepID=A0A9Q3FEX5_9BASI|nr:hypothetical protein [Austropuccinia psidii MF-1]
MNDVPSVYHQYLDVFSKVKAEKRPPHHACDHHIKLEGSLPPVGDLCIQLCLGCCIESGKPPIALNSGKRIAAELNYEIHEKELLGIVWALKRWRAFLLSLSSPFEDLTNHSSLQYFMSSKVLTCRQACRAEFLSEFHFSITYLPGRLATLLDALSCQDNIYQERGEDFISKNQMSFPQRITQDKVQPSRYFAVKVESFTNLIDSIQKALWQDYPKFDSAHITQDTPAVKLSTKILSVQKDVKRELESCHKQVHEKVSTYAYNLKLPSQWKSIHPVSHISLLEPVKTSTIPNWNQEPPPPIITEEEEEWEVSQILDSKLKRRKLWYLVEWKSFSQDPERSTWEPAKNLKNFSELFKDFHSLYPDKPGLNSSRA